MNATGYFLTARTRFSIHGSRPENVLNACAARGIELREAEYTEGRCLSVWVYEKDAEEFKKAAEEMLCYVKTEETAGGRRILEPFKRNLRTALIASFFALCLLLSSLFIWDIDVVGNEKLTDGEIKRALAECGIKPGCFWPGLDNDMVRSQMITKIPTLAWMSVNVNGSRATVPILERKMPAEIYNGNGYSDLVAKNDGILERIFVRNGKALVNRGQTVEKGERLVTGELDSSYGKTEFVRSLGEVYARTWREFTAVSPEKTLKKERRAKGYKRYALLLGKTRINFYFDRKNTVDETDKIIHNNILGIPGIFTFPVALISEEFLPYSLTETDEFDAETMKKTLESIAEKEIDGEILSAGFVSETGKGLKKATLRCECLENIAEEKAVK